MNKMAPKTKRLPTRFYLRQRIVEQDGGEELVHHGLFPELILALLKTKKNTIIVNMIMLMKIFDDNDDMDDDGDDGDDDDGDNDDNFEKDDNDDK